MAAVGFEPTPFQNSALSYRLRPLGQATMLNNSKVFPLYLLWTQPKTVSPIPHNALKA